MIDLTEYTEKIETQTLNFYALVEIALGVWMAFSPYNSKNFVLVVSDIYSPLWILSFLFIILGLLNILLNHRYFWLYVLTVSTPLIFLGIVFLQVSIVANAFAPVVILCNMIGIYSAVRAGQIFRRKKIRSDEKRERE